MNSREYLESKGALEKTRGTVELPVSFEEISVIMGVSMEDSVSGALAYARENKKVVPQYHSIKEKIGGMLYGFFYNPCVYAQNDFNEKLLMAYEEFSEQEKIKHQLFNRINDLQSRIDELSK